MSDVYITTPNPNTWNRPGGWVEIPPISALDTKFYGVYAVYENRKNNVYIGFAAGTFNCTVVWGDGTANTTVNTISTISHTFAYSALTSPILVDEYGENYKTVLVTITQNSGALNQFNFGIATSIGTYNWLDIVMSWSTARVQFVKAHPLLQRFIQYTGAWGGANINSYVQYLSRCRVFQLPPTNLGPVTQAVSLFSFLGDCEIGDLTINGGAGAITSLFANSLVRKVGNLNFNATTGGNALFQSCFNLRQVGNLNLAASTNLSTIFQSCPNLIKIGTITSTVATNLTSMFVGCGALREITFTNLAAVTVMSSTFNGCYSLENLRVPGVIITFTLVDCAMERAALVQVFNDLGTPTTTRTITVTRNPGSADLTAADLLIATSKNWIVTL
jgi:hypothetical protein